MRTILAVLLTLTVLVLVNFTIWSYISNPLRLTSSSKNTLGVIFDPRRKDHPSTNKEIVQDLTLLKNSVNKIRILSVSQDLNDITELTRQGINTMVGAWIDQNDVVNRQEIEALLQICNEKNYKISWVSVGAMALFKNDIQVQQLINYIREVQEQTLHPVSTSEDFQIWLQHPELVTEVDYIGVEFDPFWAGIAVEDAVDFVFDKYEILKKTYPNKPIVITKVGWPSEGEPEGKAIPSLANQQLFLREFISRAAKKQIPYYIFKAFDQPWQMEIEDRRGYYWGLFKENRNPKYPMGNKLFALPTWRHLEKAAFAVSMGLLVLFILAHRAITLSKKVSFAVTMNLTFASCFFFAKPTEIGLFIFSFLSAVIIFLLAEKAIKQAKEDKEKERKNLLQNASIIENEGFEGIEGVIDLFSQFQIDKGEALFKKYFKFQEIDANDLQVIFDALERFLSNFNYTIGSTYPDLLAATKLIASDSIGYKVIIEYQNILRKKYKQLVYRDDYGNQIKKDFEAELEYFRDKVLEANDNYSEAISLYIKPYFYQKVLEERNLKYPDIAKTSNVEAIRKSEEILQEQVSLLSQSYVSFILELNCALINIHGSDTSKEEDSAEELSPYDYEKFCEEQLQKAGWTASITKKGADQGADVIASYNDFELVLQCKQYNGSVGNKAVQEAIAAREYYQTNAAAVVSNATFTKSARQLASAAGVLLLHESELMTLHPNDFANEE